MKVAVCDEQPEMLHILSDILSELPIVKKVELYSDMDMCLGDLDEGNYYDVVLWMLTGNREKQELIMERLFIK